MRILQVVTLLAASGEYGGPATVATNQVRELAQLGHNVTLVAGVMDGYRPPAIPGVATLTFPVRTIGPGRSYTRIVAPSMLRWLAATTDEFDVVHIHFGRDLVSALAARLVVGRLPLYVQTHGMVQPKASIVHRLFDAALVLPVLRGAHAVFYLTEVERRAVAQVSGELTTFRGLTNGVPEAPERPPRESGDPEVLFLGRLHERTRPEEFTAAALQIARTHRATFVVAGPDEGRGPAIDRMLAAAAVDGVHREGTVVREPAVAPDEVLARLARADVFVLPARHEPLGMAVLEAMSVGVPVIVTESCGAADAIAEADAGVVVDEDLTGLVPAIAELLDDSAAARDRGRRGRRAVTDRWGARAVAERLIEHYATRTAPAGEPLAGNTRSRHA